MLLGSRRRNLSVHGPLTSEWGELHGSQQFGISVNEVAFIQFILSKLLLIVVVKFFHICVEIFRVEDPMEALV